MENKIIEINWSEWHDFPNPENSGKFIATVGPGVYQVRKKGTDCIVNVGRSIELRDRMKTLFPHPYGPKGKRDNIVLRNYILKNFNKLEYRTANAKSSEEAIAMKAQILHTCSPMY